MVGSSLSAKMVLDPVSGNVYSLPKSPLVDDTEYLQLMLICFNIAENIRAINVNNAFVNQKDFLKQYKRYLKSVGTPTALRLLEDWKHGVIYYSDGSIARYCAWH